MAGLTPAFSLGAVLSHADRFADNQVEKLVLKLAFIGERVANNARLIGAYTDRTGNLRSSIGYVILMDGKPQDKDVKGSGSGSDGKTGVLASEEFIDWASQEFRSGLVLVVFAGMEYAAAVESKGYDVLSNSVPLGRALKAELEDA